MALFEKIDPDAKAQRDAESTLRSRRRDRESLTERLGIAEAAIASFRAQARQLAADGADDKAISTAEGRMRDAQDRTVTLTGALADIDVIIGGIEAQIDQIVDKRCRRETSIAVAAMADRLQKAQAAHQAASLELEEAAKEGGILIPESQAVHQFVLSARTQLPPAVDMVVAALKTHAGGVLSGHYPASLPRPAAAPPVLTVVGPPPEPTINIFAMRNLKYVAADGSVSKAGKYKRADLPKHLAEMALASGAALPLSDKRIRDLAETASPYEPAEDNCEWLGERGRELPPRSMRPGPAAIHSSLTTFEVMDRGPAYPATMSRPPEPEAMPLTAGMRKLDGEE